MPVGSVGSVGSVDSGAASASAVPVYDSIRVDDGEDGDGINVGEDPPMLLMLIQASCPAARDEDNFPAGKPCFALGISDHERLRTAYQGAAS